jgi:drug/metabolite transporter (DMT)-like permease
MLIGPFLLVVSSALLHALWNFATKKVSGNIGVIYVGLIFASIAATPCAIIALRSYGYGAIDYRFIVATGVIHTFYFLFLSQAYARGNISVVYPIARGCGVVGTAVVAAVFLREELSLFGIAGILCTFSGILVIGLYKRRLIGRHTGIPYAVMVGVTMIFYSLVDKMAMTSADPFVYILGLFLLTTICLTPYILAIRRRELIVAWKRYKFYGFIIGLGSAVGYLIILFVFRTSQVSYVVAVRELSVAIGAMLGIRLLHEPVSRNKILGIILVVLGLLMIKIA